MISLKKNCVKVNWLRNFDTLTCCSGANSDYVLRPFRSIALLSIVITQTLNKKNKSIMLVTISLKRFAFTLKASSVVRACLETAAENKDHCLATLRSHYLSVAVPKSP